MRGNMKNTNLVIGCMVTAVVVGGVSFYGGTLYQKSKITSQFGARGNRNFSQGQNGQAGNQKNPSAPAMMGRGGAVMGEVTAKDDKTLTVKMSDGSSRIVVISDSTTYRISNEANLEKIVVGTKIATFGTANSDGSTTASSIEINPLQRELGATSPATKK